MDPKQLRALVTVAETGNMTRAASLLNIVQPAVSRQIQQLEEDVGAELFERGRHGMELTDAGKVLVEYARRILNEMERARAEIRPTRRGEIGGVVTVGMLPSTCGLLASPLVAAVARGYPGIQVRIATSHGGVLQTWLETGEVDLALLYNPRESTSLRLKPMLEEDLWLVGLPGCGLHPDMPVDLSYLTTVSLVMPCAPTGLRLLVEEALAPLGIKLQVVAETNDIHVQKALVRSGHGLAILSTIAVVDELMSGTLTGSPLVSPKVSRSFVMATSSSRHTSIPARCVAKELMLCIHEAVSNNQWPAARWIGEPVPALDGFSGHKSGAAPKDVA